MSLFVSLILAAGVLAFDSKGSPHITVGLLAYLYLEEDLSVHLVQVSDRRHHLERMTTTNEQQPTDVQTHH